jgi:hypothetical protein
MSERLCGCGCGEALNGRKSERFVSESHRARAHRAKKAAEGQAEGAAATRVDAGDHAGQPAPSNGSMGRVRGGLEAWLNTREDLPEVLVASARVLADELDAASDSSPLWGRYTVLMQALTEPQFQRAGLQR